MYESIDDIEGDESELPNRSRARNRIRLGFILLAAAALLVAAAIFSPRLGKTAPPPEIDTAAETAAYSEALAEPDPALRRARIKDFLNAYPSSGRLIDAKKELGLLDAKEASDWARLSHVIFDTKATPEDKLAALELYEQDWAAYLLGGRADDVARIREGLSGDTPAPPDREIKIDPNGFPDVQQSDVLLGGIQRPQGTYRPPVIARPAVPAPRPRRQITQPLVRRNAQPRYPRRALEKGVEAVVILSLDIDKRGRVETTELISVQAERYEKNFIKAAERAALRMRYVPQTLGGEPMAANGIRKTFRFEISE